jgi:glycerol uptake facilitator-like aquaporin
MEAIGTFFLVLAFGFTGNPIAIGIILMALIYIGSPISGSHFNPAVSFAFFLKKKIKGVQLAGYVVAQLAGAVIAAYLIFVLTTSVYYVEPPSSTGLNQHVIAEVFFTFIFVLVMLVFSLTTFLKRNGLIGIVAGLTFSGMLLISIPISGGILNPATSIGTSIVDLTQGGNSYIYTLLYTIAPLTGGALAAFAFTYFYSKSEE